MNSEERARSFLDQAEPRSYDYDLEFLTSLFDQHAAEQRQMCAKKVTKLYVAKKGDVCWKELADACLNAVEEK